MCEKSQIRGIIVRLTAFEDVLAPPLDKWVLRIDGLIKLSFRQRFLM